MGQNNCVPIKPKSSGGHGRWAYGQTPPRNAGEFHSCSNLSKLTKSLGGYNLAEHFLTSSGLTFMLAMVPMPRIDFPSGKESSYVLRLSELPRWLTRTIGWIYFAWVLMVTSFTAIVVVRSLYFDREMVPTIETIMLLVGLLVAPLFPFAQRLLFPGGGGVDIDVSRTPEESRAAEAGIGRASLSLTLPPLDIELKDKGE